MKSTPSPVQTASPSPSPAQVTWQAVQTVMPELLAQLACRWADESEYEDIAEYGAVIAKRLPPGAALVKMTKRPFGYVFTMAGTSKRFRQFVQGNTVRTMEMKGAK